MASESDLNVYVPEDAGLEVTAEWLMRELRRIGIATELIDEEILELAAQTYALGDMTDVTITSPVTGQVLTWNGSAWVNAAIPAPVATPIAEFGLSTTTNLPVTSTTIPFDVTALSHADFTLETNGTVTINRDMLLMVQIKLLLYGITGTKFNTVSFLVNTTAYNKGTTSAVTTASKYQSITGHFLQSVSDGDNIDIQIRCETASAANAQGGYCSVVFSDAEY